MLLSKQTESLELITANLSGKVRREELDGRKYLVAPLSMIVTGVLNGSDGALFYGSDEIGKERLAWNAIPIVVNHPVDKDGNPVSARSPRVLNKQGIGFVFEATHDESKLGGEGWFDEEKTRKVDRRIYNSLLNNKPIELSTGLYVGKRIAQNGANYKGKPYTHIAHSFRPDHLAILPDSKGACSLNDGCGVMVNEDKKTLKEKFSTLFSDMTEVVNKIVGIEPKPVTNCGDDCECDRCKKQIEETKQSEETNTELNHNSEEKPIMAKKAELIESLVANCDCDKTKAESRKVYETLNEEALLTLNSAMPKKKMDKEDMADAGADEEEEGEPPVKKPTKNEKANLQTEKVKPVINKEVDKQLTEEEWLAKAPTRLRNVMNKALTFEETQRDQLADKIVVNAARRGITVNKEGLLEKDSGELEFMANISSEPTREGAFTPPLYLGAAAPVANYSSKSFKDEDHEMVSPVINYAEEAAKRKVG